MIRINDSRNAKDFEDAARIFAEVVDDLGECCEQPQVYDVWECPICAAIWLNPASA